MSGKELWLHARECAIEEVMDVEELDREMATRAVDGYIDADDNYLNDYLSCWI